jgi:hypothetical protein
LTIWLDINLLASSQIGMFSSTTAIAGVFIILFGWSAWTGLELWRGRRQAIKFAQILFAIQIPVLTLPGFSYQFHTGFLVQIAVLEGVRFNFGFHLGSAFNFYISPEVQGLAIGINLVALFVLIYLIRTGRELAAADFAQTSGQIL